MELVTKNFGSITINEERVITFPSGIIGFPDLTEFTLIHDLEKGVGSIHWLQSIQEPAFAMPVMNPLTVSPDYNPEVDDEFIKVLGPLNEEQILVLVTVTIPSDLTKMSVNLQGPFIINVNERKGCQVIVDTAQYPVKYPIYNILKDRKEGE